MKSDGAMMRAFTYGSSIRAMAAGSGRCVGFSSSIISPSVRKTWYSTVGTVVMRSRFDSRSRRSCTISMCKSPRKPQRKPKPSAVDDSGSYCRLASLRASFSSASRSASYWSEAVG
jgi:hypothetical protein